MQKIKSILSFIATILGAVFSRNGARVMIFTVFVINSITDKWNISFFAMCTALAVFEVMDIADNSAKTRELLEAQNEILDESEEVEEEVITCGGNCRCGKN